MKFVISLAALFIFLGLGYISPQQTPTEPLVIVVRDGQGNPVSGVTLRLLAAGPPDEPFDSCVTDADGKCRLLLPAGAYIVRFEGGWQGQTFVPASQQNSGGLEDGGASSGGFGIVLEPSLPGQPGSGEQVVTFVVGRQAGQLVPLWDMSRSPSAPPQPYAQPKNPFDTSANPLAGIDLGPLSAVSLTPTGDAQVVESAISAGGTSTPMPNVTPTAPTPDEGLPASSAWLGVVGLVAVVVLALVGALMAARRRKERD
jgi:hypothetical protein